MKKIIFVLFMFLPIIVMGRAIDPRCNQTEKLKLRKETYNFYYATEKYKDKDQIFYKLTILNLTENIIINYLEKNYSSNNNIINNITPGSSVVLKIIAKPEGICDGYNIGTKTLVIPYYNKYKDDPLCIGNEEYFLCKENTKTKVSENEFKKQINSYIKTKTEKKQNEETEPIVVRKETTMTKILNFILKNYMYMLFGTIVICIIGITILLIKKHNSNEIL